MKDGNWVVMRVPYPTGFYTKWMDGRIDDPAKGWKGRGLWATISTRTPFHMETGKGTTSKIMQFQIRPDRWRSSGLHRRPEDQEIRSILLTFWSSDLLSTVCWKSARRGLRTPKRLRRSWNPIIAARRYTALDTPVTVEQEREFIRSFPARGVFLVALDATLRRVVGFQDVSPFADFTHAFDHVGVIGTYVDLERRRQASRAACSPRRSTRRAPRDMRSSSPTCARTMKPVYTPTCTMGSASSARPNATKIDGKYVDEILIEKRLTADD